MDNRISNRIKKILIANRGEIACRLIAACNCMGIKTVAVYSEADEKALHVQLADEAYLLGAGPPAESYLKTEKIISIAKKTKVDAIHPGYGFLSENATFAEAVEAAKITWIGPSPEVIRKMGNKIAAKKAAEKAKVPTLPWAILKDKSQLLGVAKKIGFPLLLKAAAGGGGRGMRVVEHPDLLLEKAESAMREAKGAFGSDELFLEKYCPKARHIEVQILGDNFGSVVSLGERECTLQRRHQKIIEEAPSPSITQKTREAIQKAAVQLATAVGYTNAGTCEFLLDLASNDEKFYFLEVNTRLQVEHPVTEMVWGVDLPCLQIEMASGAKLSSLLPDTLNARGHAIEARLYAEDPANGFMPSSGQLQKLHFGAMLFPGVRIDTGYTEGDSVPIFYDAMLAKVISWGSTREQATRKLIHTLSQIQIEGVVTNLDYLKQILSDKHFLEAKFYTKFLEQDFKFEAPRKSKVMGKPAPTVPAKTPWEYFSDSGGSFGPGRGGLNSNQKNTYYKTDEQSKSHGLNLNFLEAEYPGRILSVSVTRGQAVEKGDVVLVCESMKMEFSYSAPITTKVKNVKVKAGDVVSVGAVLIEWEAA